MQPTVEPDPEEHQSDAHDAHTNAHTTRCVCVCVCTWLLIMHEFQMKSRTWHKLMTAPKRPLQRQSPSLLSHPTPRPHPLLWCSLSWLVFVQRTVYAAFLLPANTQNLHIRITICNIINMNKSGTQTNIGWERQREKKRESEIERDFNFLAKRKIEKHIKLFALNGGPQMRFENGNGNENVNANANAMANRTVNIHRSWRIMRSLSKNEICACLCADCL